MIHCKVVYIFTDDLGRAKFIKSVVLKVGSSQIQMRFQEISMPYILIITDRLAIRQLIEAFK